MNPDTIGVSKEDCANLIDKWLPDKKPIIGVSASINKNNGDLYSIMFFYDGNKTHSIQNYKYKPFKDVKLGASSKKGDAFEFRAPKNSAVYKVKTYDNGDIISQGDSILDDMITHMKDWEIDDSIDLEIVYSPKLDGTIMESSKKIFEPIIEWFKSIKAWTNVNIEIKPTSSTYKFMT